MVFLYLRGMKKILLLALILFSVKGLAQKNDALFLEQIMITTFSFEQTERSLVSLIGKPETIGNYYNEIEDENWQEYSYSGNSFYFFGDKLIGFELRSAAFYFYNPIIKVGNSISGINSLFPNSYLNRGIVGDLGFVTIDISMPDGTISDIFIVINYNKVSNIITSIHLGSK
jgi:hypothetical protein